MLKIWVYILLLAGLLCSCQTEQLPVNTLADRVTEGTSKDRILFRMIADENNPLKDYFEISSEDGKVLITGNSDLSLATGLNWYLKYVAVFIFPGIIFRRSYRKCYRFHKKRYVRRHPCRTDII